MTSTPSTVLQHRPSIQMRWRIERGSVLPLSPVARSFKRRLSIATSSSIGDYTRRVRRHAFAASLATTSSEERERALHDLEGLAGEVFNFVSGYSCIDDPNLETTDEIINWVFGEVSFDLGAAIWNLQCGFYKTAASSLRTALDIAFAALYFQVRENAEPTESGWNRFYTEENAEPTESGWNRFYTEWDQGSRFTPSWGESKTFVSQQVSVSRFNKLHGCDLITEAHAHFKYLSAYVHGSAYTTDGHPVRAIETIEAHAPSLDVKHFDHVLKLSKATITWIVTLWQVAYPDLLDPSRHYSVLDPTRFEKMFDSHDRGRQAFAYRSERAKAPAE